MRQSPSFQQPRPPGLIFQVWFMVLSVLWQGITSIQYRSYISTRRRLGRKVKKLAWIWTRQAHTILENLLTKKQVLNGDSSMPPSLYQQITDSKLQIPTVPFTLRCIRYSTYYQHSEVSSRFTIVRSFPVMSVPHRTVVEFSLNAVDFSLPNPNTVNGRFGILPVTQLFTLQCILLHPKKSRSVSGNNWCPMYWHSDMYIETMENMDRNILKLRVFLK